MVDLAADEPVEIWVGAHLFRWEPPDVSYTAYAGDLDGDSAAALVDEGRKITAGKPRLFMLVNLAKVGRISREARTQSARKSQDLAICGIAIVGASTHVRIIAGLVSRAVEMMQRGKNAQTRFFTTEAEGRQWIDHLRRVLDTR